MQKVYAGATWMTYFKFISFNATPWFYSIEVTENNWQTTLFRYIWSTASKGLWVMHAKALPAIVVPPSGVAYPGNANVRDFYSFQIEKLRAVSMEETKHT